jgi:hypothetical protein
MGVNVSLQEIGMNVTRAYVRLETEPLDDVEAQLEGRIFHVTKLAYLPSIIQCGEIRPNVAGALPTTFGSSQNSFFRNRNHVSLFDYRLEPTGEIKDCRHRCYPFSPASPPNGPVAVLFLKPEVSHALVPWTKWKEEEAWSEMVVPYVEVGYPGPLPFRLVSEVISVERTEDPHSHAAMLRRIREPAG